MKQSSILRHILRALWERCDTSVSDLSSKEGGALTIGKGTHWLSVTSKQKGPVWKASSPECHHYKNPRADWETPAPQGEVPVCRGEGLAHGTKEGNFKFCCLFRSFPDGFVLILEFSVKRRPKNRTNIRRTAQRHCPGR